MAHLGFLGSGQSGSLLGRILATEPICCLPLNETSGTVAADVTGNGRNGQYSADVSGWTPYDTGLDLSAPYFDGTRTVNLLPGGTDFANCADWDECSILLCARAANLAMWTDGQVRQPLMLGSANGPGGLNRHTVTKPGDNTFRSTCYFNGSKSESTHYTSTTDWMVMVLTISQAASEWKCWINQTQIGATDAIADTWTEANLTLAVIGAYTLAPVQPWLGWLACFALWDHSLTDAERVGLVYPLAYEPYPDLLERDGAFSGFANVEVV